MGVLSALVAVALLGAGVLVFVFLWCALVIAGRNDD